MASWMVFSFFLLLKLQHGDAQILNPMDGIASNNIIRINKTDPPPEIRSPNYGPGFKYPSDQKFGWLIESSTDLADIKFSVDRFELEPTKLCLKFDYMMVFHQKEGAPWQVLENDEGYCGTLRSFQLIVNTKRMFVKFVSDLSKNFAGFNGTVQISVTETKPKIACLGLMNFGETNEACNNTVHSEETETVTVSCRAPLALPPASYSWFRIVSGVPTEIPEERKVVFKSGDIMLKDLKMSDSGTYQCVANNRRGNDTQTFELMIAEKCPCPKLIHMSWYSYPPYIYMKKGEMKGIYYTVITKMVNEVCGECELGHGQTEIVWDNEEKKNRQKGLGDIKNDVENIADSENHYDMVLPLSIAKNAETFRGKYCIPIVDSPGIALIITKEEEGASAMAMFDSILGGWPILVLVVVMATLAGIIMWMLDTYWNEEQFPRNFTEGLGEGFWWAFVTMTTVGYGDIAPVGVPGRLFAVIWILTGLIIIAIFTGVITTSLTVVAMTTNLKLYGANISAINNTAEYRFGVIRNANMRNFSNFDTMRDAMLKREVAGMLLDSYVAAFYSSQVKDFRVNNIFDTNAVYCAVLGRDLNKKVIYEKFINYLTQKKASVLNDIEANVDTLSEAGDSAAQEAAADLFSPGNQLFISSLWGTCSMLVVFTILGLLFEYVYLRPRHRMIEAAKNLEMVESVDVKRMAHRARLLKECLLSEVSEFYERWAEKLELLTRKHKIQQEILLARGGGPGQMATAPALEPDVQEAVELDNQPDELDNVSAGSQSTNGSQVALTKENETKNL